MRDKAIQILFKGTTMKLNEIQSGFNRLPQRKLNQILTYIEFNLENDICLKDLAGEAGMSIYYFARLFKQTTGKSPHQFVLEQRLNYAKYLLSQTDDSLIEVAMKCGWANQSHFTTAFKRSVGVTPRRYRNWHE
jgi:AraC family transcriptional regulator